MEDQGKFQFQVKEKMFSFLNFGKLKIKKRAGGGWECFQRHACGFSTPLTRHKR